MKTCIDCDRELPLDSFYRNNQRGGRQSVCKACDRIRRGRNMKPRRMTRAEKESALLTLLHEYIAERDAFYRCGTNARGVFTDPSDKSELSRMDAVILDASRALGLQRVPLRASLVDRFIRGTTT